MAIHHQYGFLNGFAGREFRLFCHNIGGHGIAKALDDSGNDQQQAPQGSVKTAKKLLCKAITKAVKLGEQVVPVQWLSIVLLQKKLSIPKLD